MLSDLVLHVIYLQKTYTEICNTDQNREQLSFPKIFSLNSLNIVTETFMIKRMI